jgi:hypothetical protein
LDSTKERRIPTYSADGRLLRSYSRERIESLARHGKVIVTRNRRTGHIWRAQFREIDGANPLRRSAHVGTRYSFYVRVSRTSQAWVHKDLLSSRDVELLFDFPKRESREEELRSRDRAVRSVFLAVPLSCLSAVSSTVTSGTPRKRQPARPDRPRRRRR